MIIIRNTTKDTVLSVHPAIARSFTQQLRGLMFRSSPGPGMLFPFRYATRQGVWTMCMRFPIDVVWIDDDYLAVHIESRARPWLFWKTPPVDTRFILELPAGLLEETKTEVGDQLFFDRGRS